MRYGEARLQIDVVALVPDLDVIRAWFTDTNPTEREASIVAAREKFWDLTELGSVQRQVMGVIALLNECPELADAYGYLAELKPSAAGALHERALEAATLALGPGFEKRYKGAFWADHDTRPYCERFTASPVRRWGGAIGPPPRRSGPAC